MRHSTDVRIIFYEKKLFILQTAKSVIKYSAPLAESYKITPSYFRTNRTRKVFPIFSFTPDNVPLGNSIDIALGYDENNINMTDFTGIKIIDLRKLYQYG